MILRITDLYLLSFCGLHSLSAAIFHHRIVTCAACRGQLWPPYQSAGPTEHTGTIGIRSSHCLATNVFILLPSCGTSEKWVCSSVLPNKASRSRRILRRFFLRFLRGLMSFYDRSTCNLIFFLVSK